MSQTPWLGVATVLFFEKTKKKQKKREKVLQSKTIFMLKREQTQLYLVRSETEGNKEHGGR